MIARILILDKEVLLCQRLCKFLQKNEYYTECVSSPKEALEKLKNDDFDIVLCNCFLQEPTDIELLQKIRDIIPGIIVIYISEHENIQLAVDLMKNGAYYYMLKPIFPDRLLDLLSAARTNKEKNLSSNRSKDEENDNFETRVKSQPCENYIHGQSILAKQMYKDILLVAPTDYNVIIQGETGTGKESVARLIHNHSKRADKPFIAVDCGSLSKELAASELFGHEKGAFTGALATKQGAFELAEGGTIFLDEIGNLAYEVQLFLLRSLQEKVIRKVGSVEEKKTNVRVIVATNDDLFLCVRQKSFREDLYHRLNEFSIQVPSLRERIEDLPLFIESFLGSISKRLNKDIKGFTQPAIELLTAYYWPGNIRELKNTIKRACLLATDEYISEKALPQEIIQPISMYTPALQTEDYAGEDGEYVYAPEKSDNDRYFNCLKDAALKAEYGKIMDVLKRVRFNKSKAAELLNIDRKTLYNKLKKIVHN